MSTSFGDVTASVTPCTVLNRDGKPCGQTGMPGMPPGVCEQHALIITRAVLRLGHIEIQEIA